MLSAGARRTWLEFADSFLKLRQRGAYMRTYGQIFAAPTRTTLALYAKGDASAAFQFLQTSVFIYTLAVLTRLIGGDTILTEIVIPVMLLLSQAMYLGMFYGLARRRSRARRSGHEFLVLAAYSTGFTLPIVAAPQWLQIVSPGLGALALLLVCIPLYVYVVRVWAHFWELTKRRVFCYLLATAFATSLIWFALGFAYGYFVLAHQSA